MYRPILNLSIGFVISAVSTYGLVHLIGSGLRGTGPKIAACVVLLACMAIDSGKFGLRTPMLRRQTPREHFARFGPAGGALLWGLDTGLVVTTFRVTSLTWAALGVTLFGLVPWWAGLCYALGFVLPSMAMVVVVPPSKDPDTKAEPIWLMEWLMDREKAVRNYAFLLLSLTFAGVLATVFLG
ncbi:hypothetical protein ACIBF6_42515 [Streptosporangium amethystogenes]|uniref:hypothetical protein n=1 Tax=Streptosporangium amethystogenes TaxID=2002 RepID=UPI003795C86F